MGLDTYDLPAVPALHPRWWYVPDADDGFIIQCIGQAGDNLNVLVLRAAIPITRRAMSSSSSPKARLPGTGRTPRPFSVRDLLLNRTVWHSDRLTQISRGQFFRSSIA